MKRFTKFFALVLALAMIFSLVGCKRATTEKDPQKIIVAKVGDTIITRAQLELRFDYYADYYAYNNNVDVEELLSDEETETELKNMALTELVQEEVVVQMADKLGIELTDEEKQENTDYVDGILEEIRTQLKSKINEEITKGADITDIDAEVENRIKEQLDAVGFTYDEYVADNEKAVLRNKIYNQIIGELTVTDEEIQTQYDTDLATQKAAIDEDPTQYESYRSDGYVLYAPEGVKKVYHVLIKVDDSVKEAAAAVYSDTGDAGILEVMKDALAAIHSKASNVLKKALAGEKFTDLMSEYSDDDTFDDAAMLESGFTIIKGVDGGYYDAFQKAAESLSAGQVYKSLVVTPYGYHIIYCLADVPAGAIPLADVKDSISSTLLSDKQTTLWNDTLAGWMEDVKIKYYKENMWDRGSNRTPRHRQPRVLRPLPEMNRIKKPEKGFFCLPEFGRIFVWIIID